MKMKHRFFPIILLCAASLSQVVPVYGLGTATEQNSSTRRKAATPKSKNRKRNKSIKSQTETLNKEEMRRRQSEAQKEIRQTQKQIAENDRSIKKGLADLNRLGSEISENKKQVAVMTTQIGDLNGKISILQNGIDDHRKELSIIRQKYLSALKKMRLNKGKTSALAFIFASEDFNQAMRRMRYLKQFSEWRDRQTAMINNKVDKLQYETSLLSQTKNDKNRVLGQRLHVQKTLETQHARQDMLVGELRKNGVALKDHLRKKQAEANDLRNRIAAVIAEEQRKAEMQRRAEEERRRKEEKAAEQRRIEEEKRQQQLAMAEGSEKQETEKQRKESDKKKNHSDYAKARKRRPRSQRDNNRDLAVAAPSKSDKSKTEIFSSFEAAKGSLPRPVAGEFRITSPFGRHSLPDLPDVMYDNPGIDAEVAKGASAKAVFEGRVSGVYVLPGYNNVIILNHGPYYTIYGNISAPSVKVGDRVNQGQSIGKLAVDPDNNSHSTIHFEVWRNREKLNPANWIR